MAGNSRFDHLRAPKGNKKSSPGDNRLGYSRVTESVDERALSSASTPINNPPYGSGKSSLAMGRHSVPDMTYGNELASALPRRFSNNGSASNFPSPVNARPSASRAAGGGRTPTRDENEAPSNGLIFVPSPPPPFSLAARRDVRPVRQVSMLYSWHCCKSAVSATIMDCKCTRYQCTYVHAP